MNLNDYIIDHSDFDWVNLLASWGWLLPEEFTVWIMNRFGDLFIITSNGAVHMLDVGAGTFTQIAENKDKFYELMNDPQYAANKLLIPVVDSLVRAGFILSKGECYSYKMLPAFGGKYMVENITVKSVGFHFAALGPLHEKIKDVPDGRCVKLKVIN
jgi:hypothetical protein